MGQFPSEELLKDKWVSKVRAERREDDWVPTKSSTICSGHFEDQDKYTTPKGYVRLKNSAVPVVSSDVVPQTSTPTRLEDVNLSNMDSGLDTPRNAALKNQVRKLKLEKKVLQKNNKNLKNQNQRLNKKITSMKNMLNIILEKTMSDT